MRSAIGLVAGFGLAAFGVFMVIISRMIDEPEGSGSEPDFVRGLITTSLVVGLVCLAVGVVALAIGMVGMRRAARRPQAPPPSSDP